MMIQIINHREVFYKGCRVRVDEISPAAQKKLKRYGAFGLEDKSRAPRRPRRPDDYRHIRQRVCPLRKADSATAKAFLHKVIKEMPFAITSIQTDEGAEFMKHFEEECAALQIELFILPPRSPKYSLCHIK